MNNLQNNQENNPVQMEYGALINIIMSGCKFKYFSYDHKKALEEYKTNDEFEEVRKWVPNPNCWSMPEELKEKHKTERIGKLREIHFGPNGKALRFKIGARYAKTFYLHQFNVEVFPLI